MKYYLIMTCWYIFGAIMWVTLVPLSLLAHAYIEFFITLSSHFKVLLKSWNDETRKIRDMT